MKLNYTVKYAAMPLRHPRDYKIVPQYAYEDSLFGNTNPYLNIYIVSKCYLLETYEKHFPNGAKRRKHKVVFPYLQAGDLLTFLRIEPTFCDFDGSLENGIEVDEVFDCYEDALKEANRQNKKTLGNCFQEVWYRPEKEDKIKQLRKEALRECKKYETIIAENTQDLKIPNEVKEQTFIIIKNNKAKLENQSLYASYDFRLLQGDAVYVYHVSKEEYRKMKEQIKMTNTLEQKYFNPILSDDLSCLAIYQPQTKIMPFYNYANPLEKGGFYRENVDWTRNPYMNYDETLSSTPSYDDFNLLEQGKIIYTMETYEDLLQAYLPFYHGICGIKVDGKPMQKSLPWNNENIEVITEEKVKQKCIGKIY